MSLNLNKQRHAEQPAHGATGQIKKTKYPEMKKSKISVAKLQLSKETISSLDGNKIRGGFTTPTNCGTCASICVEQCNTTDQPVTKNPPCTPSVTCPGSDLTTPCATC